jgi:hypothetical protein
MKRTLIITSVLLVSIGVLYVVATGFDTAPATQQGAPIEPLNAGNDLETGRTTSEPDTAPSLDQEEGNETAIERIETGTTTVVRKVPTYSLSKEKIDLLLTGAKAIPDIEEIDGPVYVVYENSQYEIQFFSETQAFIINLQDGGDMVRSQAQAYLLGTLDIPEAELCMLDLVVTQLPTSWAPYRYDVGLPACSSN